MYFRFRPNLKFAQIWTVISGYTLVKSHTVVTSVHTGVPLKVRNFFSPENSNSFLSNETWLRTQSNRRVFARHRKMYRNDYFIHWKQKIIKEGLYFVIKSVHQSRIYGSIAANLKSHIKFNHNEENMNECSECGFRTSSRKTMKEHNRTHDVSILLLNLGIRNQCKF